MDVDKIIAVEAKFQVAPYDDGTPRVTVSYDTKDGGLCRDCVWVETGHGSNWIAFDYTIADEVCAAIKSAAEAVRARLLGEG